LKNTNDMQITSTLKQKESRKLIVTIFKNIYPQFNIVIYVWFQALMIHVVSYVNKMKIIVSVDEGVVPDPHQICDDIEESLKLIKNAVIEKGLVDCYDY